MHLRLKIATHTIAQVPKNIWCYPYCYYYYFCYFNVNWTLLKFISLYKLAYYTLDNGPGCESDQEISDPDECKKAANQLEIGGEFLSGSWGHAPKGCFVGHPNDGYNHTFFNSQNGETGRLIYKSICKGVKKEKGK